MSNIEQLVKVLDIYGWEELFNDLQWLHEGTGFPTAKGELPLWAIALAEYYNEPKPTGYRFQFLAWQRVAFLMEAEIKSLKQRIDELEDQIGMENCNG